MKANACTADYADIKGRLTALEQSAKPIEKHCARAMCRGDGADPDKKVRGFPLWLHYLGTVRNVLAVMRAAKEFEHA